MIIESMICKTTNDRRDLHCCLHVQLVVGREEEQTHQVAVLCQRSARRLLPCLGTPEEADQQPGEHCQEGIETRQFRCSSLAAARVTGCSLPGIVGLDMSVGRRARM